jgi:uncharacterized Zn-binding protein involved in type VI secretion
MSGISRVNYDIVGGLVTEAKAPSVYADGFNVTCLGAQVEPHGIGPHANPTMIEASSTVFAEGIAISRKGDKASCLHETTGSSSVFVG